MAAGALKNTTVPFTVKSAILNKNYPSQIPIVHILLHFTDYILVRRIPGPNPTPYRNTGAGYRKSNYYLGQFRMTVLVEAPAPDTILFVFPFNFKVSSGGVKKNQINFQVKEVGHSRIKQEASPYSSMLEYS